MRMAVLDMRRFCVSMLGIFLREGIAGLVIEEENVYTKVAFMAGSCMRLKASKV